MSGHSKCPDGREPRARVIVPPALAATLPALNSVDVAEVHSILGWHERCVALQASRMDCRPILPDQQILAVAYGAGTVRADGSVRAPARDDQRAKGSAPARWA